MSSQRYDNDGRDNEDGQNDDNVEEYFIMLVASSSQSSIEHGGHQRPRRQ